MGSPSNEAGRKRSERQHQVRVQGFKFAKDEVTNREFRRFRPGHQSGNLLRRPLNGDEQPGVKVSWVDTVAYAEWLSAHTSKRYRLPTEAEWEYAARAGTKTARFWGDDPDQACRYANIHDQALQRLRPTLFNREHHNCDDGQVVTAPVGRYQPNAWGLNDMLGNVWEWTCSGYVRPYNGSEQRCQNKNYTRQVVVRGGSWYDTPRHVRAASRSSRSSAHRGSALGLRLAQD